MAVNVVVYILWQTVYDDVSMWALMRRNFLVSLPRIQDGAVWTLITSAFSHSDPMHLLVNMLALYVFGGSIYPIIGPRGFLHLYLAGGIIASVGHVVFSWLGGDMTPALGASGSVMAIAVVYGATFPKRTLLINFILPVPAAIAVSGYILYDIWGLFTGGDGIAHAAHLGGAVYGAIYWALVVRPLYKELTQER